MKARDLTGGQSRTDLWSDHLFPTLRDAARPLFVFENTTIPAPSVLTGARHWVESFQAMGLDVGDRLLVSLDPGPEFLQVLTATFWSGSSPMLVDPETEPTLRAVDYDAAGLIVDTNRHVPDRHAWRADGLDGPTREPETIRDTDLDKTPGVRLWIRNQDDPDDEAFYGLDDRNLLTVLERLSGILTPADTILSCRSWYHWSGLVTECLFAFFNESRLVSDHSSGRDPRRVRRLAGDYGADLIHPDPELVQSLQDHTETALSDVPGGIVWGVVSNDQLADCLRSTSLRPGFGHAKTAGGFLVGQPGKFEPAFLGRPLTGQVNVTANGRPFVKTPQLHRAQYNPVRESLNRFDVPR